MSDTPSPPALFAAGQARVVALVRALDAGDLARPLPATPGWSDWRGDPEPYLPVFSPCGGLRTHDLVE